MAEKQTPLKITEPIRAFILHWGEMGSRWGISRTVAQIHALLYLAPRPLHAEEIAEDLSLARSTVSTSLRELQGWGVIRLVHVMGDRRDHFEAVDDVWEMFRIIVAERKRREIDPTLAILHESVEEIHENGGSREMIDRLESMLEFFESMEAFYGQADQLPTSTLKRVIRSQKSLQEWLGRA